MWQPGELKGALEEAQVHLAQLALQGTHRPNSRPHLADYLEVPSERPPLGEMRPAVLALVVALYCRGEGSWARIAHWKDWGGAWQRAVSLCHQPE